MRISKNRRTANPSGNAVAQLMADYEAYDYEYRLLYPDSGAQEYQYCQRQVQSKKGDNTVVDLVKSTSTAKDKRNPKRLATLLWILLKVSVLPKASAIEKGRQRCCSIGGR